MRGGGDLGYIARTSHHEIFDTAIDRIPGEIIGPFPVLEGLSIIKVLDHRLAQAQTFEDARTKLNAVVTQEKRTTRYAQWITELKRKYRVEVRKEVFDSVFLSTN